MDSTHIQMEQQPGSPQRGSFPLPNQDLQSTARKVTNVQLNKSFQCSFVSFVGYMCTVCNPQTVLLIYEVCTLGGRRFTITIPIHISS